MARVDAVGPQLTILHNFGNGALRPDPAYPSGGLIQAADGTFFGVATVQRGSQDSERAGAVFQFWSTGEFEVIQDFPHPLLLDPVCPLLLYKGDLIGMCSGAPKWDNPGAVFRLKFSNATGRWQITLWHDFVSDQLGEGAVPNAPLIVAADGYLYGTAYEEGISTQSGIIFRLHPENHVFAVVHRFAVNSEGIDPVGPLLLTSDGNYYGTTAYGPGNSQSGTIFAMTPTGKVATVYTYPFKSLGSAAMIQGKDGNLYGATCAGGVSGSGTVYKMTPRSYRYGSAFVWTSARRNLSGGCNTRTKQ